MNSDVSSILARYALTRSTDVKWLDSRPAKACSIVIFRSDGRESDSAVSLETLKLVRSLHTLFLALHDYSLAY